jgi:hypothetical protein
MVGPQQISLGGDALHFSFAKNTLFFTLIVQRVLSFSRTAFSFVYCLDFCSDLVISLHQGVFRPLVYDWFSSKELSQKRFEWCWKREKVSCKKWYKKELV